MKHWWRKGEMQMDGENMHGKWRGAGTREAMTAKNLLAGILLCLSPVLVKVYP